MAKKLAVAVIHGMGQQIKKDPMDSAEISFSRALRDRLRVDLGSHAFDAGIAWREIYWAHELQPRQDAYEAAMRKVSSFGWLRRFVMHRLSDAGSYYKPEKLPGSTYDKVHGHIERVIAELEADVPPGTPLLLIAHSLGGHMLSNYIWDVTHGSRPVPGGFQSFESFAGFVTFGCNIPVFVFAHDKVTPIQFPGFGGVAPVSPWWRNYYSRSDPLGYPLKPIGFGYADLAEAGGLRDYPIAVGFPVIESLTPLSHNAYWRDRGFARRVAGFMRDIMA